MTRAGSYGQSRALKALAAGNYDEALEAVAAAMAADPKDPEPLLDRAQIRYEQRQWQQALDDLERAQALDAEAGLLDDSAVDDTLFSTLVGWAQEAAAAGDGAEAVRRLQQYSPRLRVGDGTHHDEAASWIRRFQGHVEMWVKPQDA